MPSAGARAAVARRGAPQQIVEPGARLGRRGTQLDTLQRNDRRTCVVIKGGVAGCLRGRAMGEARPRAVRGGGLPEADVRDARRLSGYLELARARVRWFLSSDIRDLPFTPEPGVKTTFRSITVDGDEIECTFHFGKFHVPSEKATEAPCFIALKTYLTSVRDGQVYVDLEKPSASA